MADVTKRISLRVMGILACMAAGWLLIFPVGMIRDTKISRTAADYSMNTGPIGEAAAIQEFVPAYDRLQSLDFEDCRLNEIEWAPLMSNGAFPDPIHTLKECSLKYNTFTEMNFNRFDFSDGNEIVGSMFAKCEMQLANFKGVELHETEFYQCDLRKADFRDATQLKK